MRRPREGLGVGSAMSAAQLMTRRSRAAKPARTARVSSRKPQRSKLTPSKSPK